MRNTCTDPRGGRLAPVLFLLCVALLMGCSSTPSAESPAPPGLSATPTTAPRFADLLLSFASDFSTPEGRERAPQTLALLLSDPEALALSDEALSRLLTETLTATGLLALPDPVLLRRQAGLTVASLPDGVGLYLIDGDQTLRLSPWNLSILDLELYPATEALGVRYARRADNGARSQHFVLAERSPEGWALVWLSDEELLWWFNNRNASIEISRDLSRISVSGEARAASDSFIELPGGPVRLFTLDWQRVESGYQPDPSPSSFETRRGWMARIAQPSPYDTLVQFIDALAAGDGRSAAGLLIEAALLDQAYEFALNQRGRRYTLLETPETGSIIRFGDEQGRYEVRFTAPARLGDPWLITSLISLNPPPAPTAAPTP